MKTNIFRVSWFLAAMILLVSCQYPREVRSALRQSGDNRAELEKVLRHYRQNRQDSLSLEAAMFLIANMPGHYTSQSASYLRYLSELDSMYPDMSNVIKRVVSQIPLREGVAEEDRLYDISTVDAAFLISHIDRMMAAWQECPWLKEVGFEDFCEYLLPYRFANEPLITQTDSTDFRWQDILSQTRYYGNLPLAMQDIRHFLHNMIDRQDDPYMQDTELPLHGKTSYTFDCLDRCHYNVATLRSSGVPTVIDYVPEWPTRNGRHYWYVMLDPSCVHDIYSEAYNPRAAKVYRQTYSRQETARKGRFSGEHVPPFFLNPFNRDVTACYTKVSDLRLPIRSGNRYAYLAVFNELSWKPIAYAPVRMGRARFEDMGRGVVYLPVVYKGESMHSAGNPILLRGDGSITTLNPREERVRLCLTRKYPLTYSKTQWSRNMTGCCIEASNDSTFSICTLIDSITTPDPDLNFVEAKLPDSLPAFRYWRIRGKKRLYVGELHFLDKEGRHMEGRPISTAENAADKNPSYPRAFDGDILTYSNTARWMGVDFGSAQKVNSIRHISRTDGNGIVPGNDYELFYFDGNWVSSGRRQAATDSLVFEDVPSGALYWLHNHTEGREERIFTFDEKYNRIEFW